MIRNVNGCTKLDNSCLSCRLLLGIWNNNRVKPGRATIIINPYDTNKFPFFIRTSERMTSIYSCESQIDGDEATNGWHIHPNHSPQKLTNDLNRQRFTVDYVDILASSKHFINVMLILTYMLNANRNVYGNSWYTNMSDSHAHSIYSFCPTVSCLHSYYS